MEDDHRTDIPTTFSRDVFNMLDDLDQHLYFRWDLTNDCVTLHEPLPHRFRDLPLSVPQASTMFWTERLIHPEDRPILHAYLHAIFRMGGKPITDRMRKASCKLRIRHHRGNYLWAEVHIITYFEAGVPVVAYGNLRSIQAEKLWQKRLQAKADRDSLTGLLRKDAAIHQMKDCIEGLLPGRDQAALLLIDADGFKAINDNFGHLFGDGVLSEMGRTIRNHFRKTDIKGRIGGDEFLVLLRNTQGTEGIQGHLAKLLTALHHNYQSGGRTLPFSISIGVALYPAHGTTYRDLFSHADRALYEAKSRGKNQSCFYQPKFYQEVSLESGRDPASTVDLQMRAFEDNMAEFVLQLFYETNSPEATINYAMSLLGKLYNLDRIVIARCNEKTGRYVNAFEWVGPDGDTLTGPQDTRMAMERWRMILDAAHPTPYGVLSICENTEKLEPRYAKIAYFYGLKAYAYGLIPHGAETMGCIGVESVRPMPIRKELLRSLNLFSVLLGNILLPQDSSLALKRRLDLYADILDHLGKPCYVIDRQTNDVIYANASAHAAGACDLNAPGKSTTLLREHTKEGHGLLLVTQNDEELSCI